MAAQGERHAGVMLRQVTSSRALQLSRSTCDKCLSVVPRGLTSGTSSTGVEWLSLKAPCTLTPERSSRGSSCVRNMVMRPQSSLLDGRDSLRSTGAA